MITARDIVVRPERRYAGGRLTRGQRRHDNTWGRSLALLDSIGIAKRTRQVALNLSEDGAEALRRRAALLRVSVAALAAFLVESALRADRCRAGHDLVPGNVIEENGRRRCRACRIAYFRARRQRMAAEGTGAAGCAP